MHAQTKNAYSSPLNIAMKNLLKQRTSSTKKYLDITDQIHHRKQPTKYLNIGHHKTEKINT